MWQQDIYSVDFVPLFGRLMILIFCSNLAIVFLIKGLWNAHKFRIMSQFLQEGGGQTSNQNIPFFYVPKCLGRVGVRREWDNVLYFCFVFFLKASLRIIVVQILRPFCSHILQFQLRQQLYRSQCQLVCLSVHNKFYGSFMLLLVHNCSYCFCSL